MCVDDDRIERAAHRVNLAAADTTTVGTNLVLLGG